MNQVHRDALSFLNRIQAEAETEDIRNASCFVVCAYDPECDKRTYHGPFTDPVDAMAWANQFTIDLNNGLETDQPDEVTVQVVLKTYSEE